MYEFGQYFGPVPRCKEEAMRQQSKDEELPDRTAEVAFAIAEEGMRAGGDSVRDSLPRERRSQFHDGRQVAADGGVSASNEQQQS